MNSTLKQHSGDHLPADKRADTAPSAHDVDEIERFLREEFEPRLSAQQQGGPVDPLMAELARIVGQEVRPVAPTPPAMPRAHDPFSADPGAGKALNDADLNDPLRAFEEELRRFDAAHGRAAPTPEPEVAAALEAPVDPYAVPPPVPHIEPDLRLSPANEAHYTHAERDFAAYPDEAQRYGAAPDLSASREVDPALEPQGVIAEDLMPVVPPPAAPRSRKVMYLLGGAAAFALTGVIGSIAFGNKTPKPNEIPVIAAKTQPAKEKPADPGGVEVPGQDRQVLARKVDEPAKAAAVVTKEEQPVDLNQTPKRDVARVVLPAPGQGNAPAQPVIMPQGAAQPPAAQPAAGTPPPATAGGFEAKRVRSVKIGGEGEAAPAAPSAPATPAAPAARPTTPSLAAAPAPVPAPIAAAPKVEPPKVEAPKSDARPTTVARPAQTTTTPPPARTPPRPAAPAPAAQEDGEAPMSLRPPSGAQPRPTRTAAATPAAPATPATSDGRGGGFAVQLAAPGSEAEARATASRLKQRYADALDGYSPGVRKADVSGRTVYRVRVGGLSRQDANDLCTRIKSDGGSCFVASN